MREMISESPPPISVVMAVHNCVQFVCEAVDSILNQEFKEFEFIIVDDGSTDGTSELLEQYAKSDHRVRLVRQANVGLTKSLNGGSALARGELIARMDGDDIAMPDRFTKQVPEFVQDPSLVLLGGEVELISEDGHDLGSRGHLLTTQSIRSRLLRGDGGALTHPAVMIRRSALERIGAYDEEFTTTQDLDLFLRLSELGAVRNLPQTLLRWRQHPHSVNRTKSATWSQMRRLAIKKTIDRIGVERYLEELFPVQAGFSFPSDPFDLAQFADRHGRRDSAKHFLKEAWRRGQRRGDATESLVEMSIQESWWKLRGLGRRMKKAFRSA